MSTLAGTVTAEPVPEHSAQGAGDVAHAPIWVAR
jgi:hypothetical protein